MAAPRPVEQNRRGQWHMLMLLAISLPLMIAARHPGYLRLRGGLDENGLHAGGGAGTIEEEQRKGDPEQPSGAVPSALQRPEFGKPLLRPAPLRLGRRRGVVRALKKGFGFIRMETLPGEPSPTDVYFDFAEQEAERIKRVKAGDKVLFTLNHGPKRTLRGYGVTFDGGGAMEAENTFTTHLRQVGLPAGLKGREPRKAMGPFAWGEESIRIYKERKAKRKAQRHGQAKTHDSEGFPIARAADALPLQSMTPAQLKSERMRRRASQRARRIDGGVLASGAGGASAAGERLPEGWERRLDARGRPYYIDWNTLKSTWAPPPGYTESLAPAAGAPRHPAADYDLPPLGELDDLRQPFAAPLGLASILGSKYSNSSLTMILPELGMQIKGTGAQQLSIEDAGRKAARLVEIMASVAQAPLAAGLRDAYSNGTLADLLSSSEGLKSLHGLVLQDLGYVQDASWHALLRRLDNKSPEERRDWLRSKDVDMQLLYKSMAQMLLLLHTAAAASPSSMHTASGTAAAPPDASPVLPAAAPHGALAGAAAVAAAPDGRVQAALAHMATWGGREADSEQQSCGHGQKRCDIALTQGNVARGEELEGMVERLADADTDSEGGDDGLFFRPNAQTFQLPDEVKDTPLGCVLDKMRSEDFDHLQRVCSQPPHPKYFAHERAVNETFRRAIAAAADAEARVQEMEDAAVDELCQVEALARTHPRLYRWFRALVQGPDLIAHTEEAMSNFTRLSRACFGVDVASSSAKAAGAGTEAQHGGRGKGGDADAWLHDLGELVVRELGPGAQIDEAAQVLAEASPMMARAIEEFNALIRDNSTLHHALFFARGGSIAANTSVSSPHSSLLGSCVQGNSTRGVGAGPDEADGACSHRAHLMRLLAASGASVPAALAGFDDYDDSEALRPLSGSRSRAGCPGRSLRKRLRNESWAGDSRDGGSVFLEEGGQCSKQENGVGDVDRDDGGGDQDSLSSESSAARKRHCLGQAMQGKVRVDKEERGDGVDARLAALSSGRRETGDAACREPDEQSADDELLSRFGWQTSSQKDTGKRLEEAGNGGVCSLDGEEKGAREDRQGDADGGTEGAGAGWERKASGQEADESSDACARLAREKRLWAKVGLGALVLTDDELLEPWSSSSRAEGGSESSGGGEEQARGTTGLPAQREEVDLKLAYPACGVQAVHREREHDVDVFHRNRRLWRAARAGNATVCSELLAAGAHANYARADRGGQGPLHVACHLGLVEIVNVLLSSGGVANMPDFCGRRPLLYAAVGSGTGSQGAAGGGRGANGAHLEVVEALIAAGARTCCKDPMSEDTALHEAARANRCDIISALLRGGACASSRNLGGQRALEVAVDEGCAEAAEQLRQGMGLAVAGRDAVKVSHILIKHSASRKATSRLDAEGKQIKERSVPDARAALIRVRRRLVADCASFRAGSQDGSGCESAVPGAGAGEERRATDGMALDHVEQLFAAAARNVSDCNSAITKGGALGTLTAGKMQREFEEAAFALQIGEMSGVVETASGCHLILRTG